MEELQKEKEQLLHGVEEFETKTRQLEAQLKESQEKLQLVVEFPSIDAKQSSQPDHTATFNGDSPSEAEVAQDMERQVMANNIRILTLEEQNEKLRKSIAYLMNVHENITKKKVCKNIVIINYFNKMIYSSELIMAKQVTTFTYSLVIEVVFSP